MSTCTFCHQQKSFRDIRLVSEGTVFCYECYKKMLKGEKGVQDDLSTADLTIGSVNVQGVYS